MLNPSSLQIITGILLLFGAVVIGAADAPRYAIPVVACLFILVEIARGKYSIKVSGSSSEVLKMLVGFVILFLIQCLIAWGLISLGGFLAKNIFGGTLSFSWFVGLGMVAFFSVLPFFIPSLKRKQLIESILAPVLEEHTKLEGKQIESGVLGTLIQHDQFDDWWLSEQNYIPCIEKEGIVTYTDCEFKNADKYLEEADNQLKVFLQMTKDDLWIFTPEVKANLELNIDATDFEEDLPFMNLKTDEDVWLYLEARQIYVNKENEDVIISLPFDCDWEQEHGFRLDFKNGTELVYSGQDY